MKVVVAHTLDTIHLRLIARVIVAPKCMVVKPLMAIRARLIVLLLATVSPLVPGYILKGTERIELRILVEDWVPVPSISFSMSTGKPSSSDSAPRTFTC